MDAAVAANSEFSIDAVIQALYTGILGRAPDPVSLTHYRQILEQTPGALPGVVKAIAESVARVSLGLPAEAVVDGLYQAALGRVPDPEGRATYVEAIRQNPGGEIVARIGRDLFYSPEHQDRLIPVKLKDRVLVDRSPRGESFFLIKHIVSSARPGGVIVEVGLRTADTSFSLDIMRLCGWRGILIQSSQRDQSIIASRFSGLDVVHRPDQILDFGLVAEDLKAVSATNPLAFFERQNDQATMASLAEVLDREEVPGTFDVLALHLAQNTFEKFNQLVRESAYRPQMVIIETTLPEDVKNLSQLGLSDEVIEAYTVIHTTNGSIVLKTV